MNLETYSTTGINITKNAHRRWVTIGNDKIFDCIVYYFLSIPLKGTENIFFNPGSRTDHFAVLFCFLFISLSIIFIYIFHLLVLL